MKPNGRLTALLALPFLLAACVSGGGGESTPPDAASAEAAASVPTAFRLIVSGKTAAVLDGDQRSAITLAREGVKEPLTLPFGNDVPAVHPLAPGRYSIAGLGPLTCRGLDFEVGASGARALGTVQAEIVATDYYVALMKSAAASPAEIADLAAATDTDPGAIDARPLAIAESAPCYIGRGGPGTTWRDRPLGEQILLGIGFAAFCAVAVASGGLCAF